MAVIQMPSRGGKEETGMITTWYKKTGDWVAQGDELFSFDTDEGTYTVKSQKAGRLVAIFVPEGELVHCPADVGMLASPTPENVLQMGRQQYLDESKPLSPREPAPPAEDVPADAPAAIEEPAAPEAAEESPVEAEPAPEEETPAFAEEELLQTVQEDLSDLAALDDAPSSDTEPLPVPEDAPAQDDTPAEENIPVEDEAPTEEDAPAEDEPAAQAEPQPACLTAQADLTCCNEISARTGIRLAAMVRFAAMHTALADLLEPAPAQTLRALDALDALPGICDLTGTGVTAAWISSGAPCLILPAPHDALRLRDGKPEVYPCLNLSLRFDAAALPMEEAAAALTTLCRSLENLLDLLL